MALDFSEKQPAEFDMQKTFSAFLGIINILDKGFLLFADEVSYTGSLEEADIFQIATIAFIPFEVVIRIMIKNKISNFFYKIEGK